MAIIEYTIRIQEADWDFGGTVGERKVLCYHQFVDSDGVAVDHTDETAGTWEAFIPGPVIRGNVGDTIVVTVQNRIKDEDNVFVDGLKTGAIVHWHGIELANAHDGTPVTQRPIPTGQDFVYRFKLERPGVFWYHPHFDGLLQEHLGAYGPILVEDANTATLRAEKIIPHSDRTFYVGLSDVSFQDGPSTNPIDGHFSESEFPTTGTVYIRNIENAAANAMMDPVSGDENFGDIWLVNGKKEIPFNDPIGNFQQFWPAGQRQTAASIVAHEGESFAFQILNMGLHRFYKIHLAFRSGAGDWEISDDLYWIGGQGGLLNKARGGGGENENYRVRGRKQRNAEGANQIQSASELLPGEFLLPTSARIELAFTVQTGWTEVALRVNGFSVQNGPATADEKPENMIVARFPVGTTPNSDFVLSDDLAGADLLLHSSVDDPLEDLAEIANVVTAYTACDADTLFDNGVVVPDGALSTASPPGALTSNYDVRLTGGPSLDGEQVHWMPGGPRQPTPGNTRYVQKDDVVEWTIETTTQSDHPWHMHGFSFQPIKMELNTPTGLQTIYTWDHVEYLDSIHVPAFHRLTVRFRVKDRPYIGEDGSETATGGVVGRWLAHCHITKHAHRGMMMNFFALDGCDIDDFQHVDVYLRDDPNDDGTEPSTGNVSGSPDIIVRDEAEPDPIGEFGPGNVANVNSSTLGYEVEYGQENYIYVRVNNRGNQPANSSTDVYWSEVSTLVTPDQWHYIGQTAPMMVQPGELTVSDALVWPPNEIPVQGHYCMVGVTGSEQDVKPISPKEAASYPTFANLDDFRAFIRGHNNVTWRNFNVIEINPTNDPDSAADVGAGQADSQEKSARFKFRGAFDKDRFFDLVIENPFQMLRLEVPDDARLRRDLDRQDVKYEARNKTLSIALPGPGQHRLKNLLLVRNRDYRSQFVIVDRLGAMVGKSLYIAQEVVEDYVRKIAETKAKQRRLDVSLKAEKDEKKIAALTATASALKKQLDEYRRLAADPTSAAREELGRVTWAYVEDRRGRLKPKPGFLCILLAYFRRLILALLGR